MKTSTKLVTIFAAVATLSLQGAFAIDKTGGWDIQKPKLEKPTFSLNWGGSFDYASNSLDSSVDDLENFDDLGEKIRVRDLNISVDAMMSIFAARVTLEENSQDLSIDGKALEEKVRDLYVGIQPMSNLVILYGKTDVPFGADQSERSENEVTKLNEQLERKLVAAVQVNPTFMSSLKKLGVEIQSIEVAAFSSKSSPSEVKFNDELDSYSVRTIAQLGKVLTQASYMKIDDLETRTSVSGSTGLSTKATGAFQVYAELQLIRDSYQNGNINLGTVGVSKSYRDGKITAYAEGTRIQNKGTSANARNAGAVGAKYHINDMVSVGAELSTHAITPSGVISSDKDATVMATLEVKKRQKQELFNLGKKKDADGSELRDAAARMRAK